ncbi:PPOX class probable FMN-dependent enzyme, DR_2398 family [Geodermatophilus pulveris]|uniref:PPOX class probable FMN-dependent enzyme, DR_2398 family n=1 Tax=Geodermatophilus pulveris TaxID=1564159 RepID=A0A239HY06_9ACTN|nr:MSMEG_1061 family FMN-dependent PPOX-type flavoprotein [Geodermatophilus pulveris]SNS85978.1 PPOX class probable FMN-dependent enzyme, DR_2398 family [Geodermatophilus pulveris]
MDEITTEAELRELRGEPSPVAPAKERDRLHELDRQWLAASPFCLVSTSGADGSCDVSPEGDPPGFTLVLDDRTIALPERAGNRRANGYRDVLTNPDVALLHLLPGRGDTLRVDGRARLRRDPALLDRVLVRGHRPRLALVVEVEQVSSHCAGHSCVRSVGPGQLDAGRRPLPCRDGLPTRAPRGAARGHRAVLRRAVTPQACTPPADAGPAQRCS